MRPPHALVGVEDIDVPGAGRVGLGSDGAGERCVLDEAADCEPLAGLEIDPDVDREPRVGGEGRFEVAQG